LGQGETFHPPAGCYFASITCCILCWQVLCWQVFGKSYAGYILRNPGTSTLTSPKNGYYVMYT